MEEAESAEERHRAGVYTVDRQLSLDRVHRTKLPTV